MPWVDSDIKRLQMAIINAAYDWRKDPSYEVQLKLLDALAALDRYIEQK